MYCMFLQNTIYVSKYYEGLSYSRCLNTSNNVLAIFVWKLSFCIKLCLYDIYVHIHLHQNSIYPSIRPSVRQSVRPPTYPFYTYFSQMSMSVSGCPVETMVFAPTQMAHSDARVQRSMRVHCVKMVTYPRS